MVQMKGDRRNIFAQSGTWFRTMLELTAAAYTIVGSASWEHHRGERLGEGRARHGEISTEHCWPWLHETQKSQELSVCNVQDLLHWAAKLGTTEPTIFTLRHWAQPWPGTVPWFFSLQHPAVPSCWKSLNPPAASVPASSVTWYLGGQQGSTSK